MTGKQRVERAADGAIGERSAGCAAELAEEGGEAKTTAVRNTRADIER
jgi:hypothetical protein